MNRYHWFENTPDANIETKFYEIFGVSLSHIPHILLLFTERGSQNISLLLASEVSSEVRQIPVEKRKFQSHRFCFRFLRCAAKK